ncbi:MAG: hypothetical protein NTX19_03360 [Gemmatimonadetes bacterium]|nr:hypothetical protein [Gemmatimonadota bacterium]
MLTLARDLKRRKARERSALFVSEGVRAVEDLLRAALPISGVLATESVAEHPRGAALIAAVTARGLDVATVSEEEFKSAADTEHPQGV